MPFHRRITGLYEAALAGEEAEHDSFYDELRALLLEAGEAEEGGEASEVRGKRTDAVPRKAER